MTARDDYERAPLTQATYEAMCDEIDRLRKLEDAIGRLIVHALVTGEPIRIEA